MTVDIICGDIIVALEIVLVLVYEALYYVVYAGSCMK